MGDLRGISHFELNPSHFRQLQTTSLSWALRGLQMRQTNGALKVPLLFHPTQRELRYGPASAIGRVHKGTDQKAGKAGFLEDPTQVETVVVLCGARSWTQKSLWVSSNLGHSTDCGINGTLLIQRNHLVLSHLKSPCLSAVHGLYTELCKKSLCIFFQTR